MTDRPPNKQRKIASILKNQWEAKSKSSEEEGKKTKKWVAAEHAQAEMQPARGWDVAASDALVLARATPRPQ